MQSMHTSENKINQIHFNCYSCCIATLTTVITTTVKFLCQQNQLDFPSKDSLLFCNPQFKKCLVRTVGMVRYDFFFSSINVKKKKNCKNILKYIFFIN